MRQLSINCIKSLVVIFCCMAIFSACSKNDSTSVTPSNTVIKFTNTTHTAINIYGYGGTAVIPVGGSMSFSGSPGTSFSASAYTYGTASNGAQLGERINWNLSETFPSSDTLRESLSVSSSYFYLQIKNVSSYTIGGRIFVNYYSATGIESFDNVVIPNDGVTYSIGYFNALTTTDVRMAPSPATGAYWDISLALPFITDQVGLVTATD